MDDDELASALRELDRLADEPARLSEPFVECFPVSGAAVSTVGDLLGSETLSASDPIAARIDESQFDLGEGPCWDAMSTGRPVLVPDLRAVRGTRWPAFTNAMADQPVSSLFAFPLIVGSLRIGAIDLYSVSAVQLDTSQSRRAGTMADAVGKHVLRRALNSTGAEFDEPENARSRRVIHQATGMVLAQLRVPGVDARLMIQGQAFATGRSMMQVAQDVLDGRLSFSRGADGIEASR